MKRRPNDGELLTSLTADGQIRVDKADASIGIDKELLEALEAEEHPAVSVAGDMLTIRAINGTFRYELLHWGWTYGGMPLRVAHLIEEEQAS